MKKQDEKYCVECGKTINIKAELCPFCGVRQPYIKEMGSTSNLQENKWLATLLFCWFLGVFGVHRFYTGHTTIGVIQLLTLGGCGIWVLVDFIMIVTGNFKDVDGNPIKSR